ncbi:MAG TPA: autotransporter assembly complex family protein [Burkholderiaceae bacterium]|nr:autotransporter assembly complex family protein [Burkholderiaceae bacterium]
MSEPVTMAFTVEVQAPRQVQAYLLRHLDLLRYRELQDLDDSELERLQIAAERNTRDLLGTLGYFSPQIEISRVGSSSGDIPSARIVRIAVQPGPPTLVTSAAVQFSGAIASDPDAIGQRSDIERRWALPPGKPFTQEGWDEAKTQALRQLAARRYPLGRIATSRAEIDPQENSARLGVTLDSGPLYRLGELTVSGLERYDPELVQRIARLKPGTTYDQTSLLEAQQRLQDSGYFNSVVLELDPSGDPQAAPVVVTVREALRNRLQLGVGVSTDSGLRLSVEHTSLKLPLIDWRADSKLLLDGDTRSLETELLSQPDEDNWRWSAFGQLKNEDAASVRVRSQQLRAGRLQRGERIDRNYYLQYDRATTTGVGLNETAQSISANYAWTQRNFDRLPYPSTGYGLGVEIGGGLTLGAQREPFFRTRLNWLGIWSLDSSAADKDPPGTARAGRIAVRLQAGAVMAKDSANIPSTQLFLAGGDASVRGYSYRSIGSAVANGIVTPGRYLAVASLEWQRPILVDGLPSPWESTVFIDAGAVADKTSQFDAKVGIGAGVRYRSPVGPLQLDLAYGLDKKALRLHLSVGFTF